MPRITSCDSLLSRGWVFLSRIQPQIIKNVQMYKALKKISLWYDRDLSCIPGNIFCKRVCGFFGLTVELVISCISQNAFPQLESTAEWQFCTTPLSRRSKLSSKLIFRWAVWMISQDRFRIQSHNLCDEEDCPTMKRSGHGCTSVKRCRAVLFRREAPELFAPSGNFPFCVNLSFNLCFYFIKI